jgi:hypothetical protein
MAGVIYGLFIAAVILLVEKFTPQPLGSAILWVAFAVQLAWAALLTWRRTGLPFASAAMLISAAGMMMFAVLGVSVRVVPSMSTGAAMALGALIVTGPLCLLAESRVHPKEWAEWKGHMEQATLWEMLTGRHIPDLRHVQHGR